MTYFKINNTDFSAYVSKLKVAKKHTYKARTNAAGNTRVQHINSKYVIEVGIIPLDNVAMKNLLAAISNFQVSITFLSPETNTLQTIDCMITEQAVDYYTIQDSNVKYQAFSLVFTEL